MIKYRRKVRVVEAFQMTKARRWDNSEWPNWLHEAWQKDKFDHESLWCVGEDLLLTFCSSILRVNWDDWIIKGEYGGLHAVPADYFDENYEVIKEK
jgi:hypothetical protein